MRVYDRLVQILYANMSLSRHFPPSTQTILSAQCTPPPAKKRRDKSIIVISSSPDDNPVPITIDSPPRIFCSDDEEFFGPARSNSPPLLPAAVARKQSRQGLENLALDVNEDDTFSRIIGEYKYTHPKLLTDTANIPRASLQKVNLDGFFQETKKPTTNPPTKSRVKNTLTTRVSLPKRRTSTSNAVVDKLPSSESIAATVSRDHVRFFTSWAAAQAPTTRTKPTAKPRRKTMQKRNSVEVVLLSPRTGQESVRRRVGCEIGGGEGKLGERSDGASAMWDACKRGLDGELYDCDGEVVFSQELRPNVSIDNENEGNSTMKTDDVEIFDMTKSQESSSTMQEDVMTILDTEVRQRNQEVVVLDNRDTSPDTPLQNVSPVSPPPPAEITSQFDQSLEIIDITDLPHTQQTTNTIPVPKIDSPLPIRPKHKENPTTTARSDPIPNYSTYTLAQLQVPHPTPLPR